MKRIVSMILSLALILALAVTLTSCGGKELTSLSVDETGGKLTYEVGEAFTSDGIVVTAKYSDDSTETLSNADVVFSGFDSSAKAEGQTITVTYGEKSTSYQVDIVKTAKNSGQIYQGLSKPVTTSMTWEGETTETTAEYECTIEIVDDETLIYGSNIMMGFWGYWNCSYTTEDGTTLHITVEGQNTDRTHSAITGNTYSNGLYTDRAEEIYLTVKLDQLDTPTEIADAEGNVTVINGTFTGVE